MIRWIKSWPPRTKAAVLSLLIAGLGQVYLGRFGRALIWFAGVVAMTLTLDRGGASQSARAAFGVAIGVLSSIDAAAIAPRRPPGGDGDAER